MYKYLPLYRSVKIMGLLLIVTVFGSFSLSAKDSNVKTPAVIAGSKQLMVVLTDNWDDKTGTIYCFSRHKHQWILQSSNAVVIGSKGLGIGDGIMPIDLPNGPVKKEGDKKSPAGIFTIGTAFGYADKKDAGFIHNRYIKASDTLICVDDINSAHYNTLINNDSTKSDYKSFEHMHLARDYYKWGLFINHNTKPLPGDGSCIFMHIWGSATEGTDGCTAMAENNLLRILRRIDAKEHPLLVQLTKSDYKKIRSKLTLPVIK